MTAHGDRLAAARAEAERAEKSLKFYARMLESMGSRHAQAQQESIAAQTELRAANRAWRRQAARVRKTDWEFTQ